jgi:hypothetical protein
LLLFEEKQTAPAGIFEDVGLRKGSAEAKP